MGKKKRVAVWILSLLLTGLFSGCAASQSANPQEETLAPNEYKIYYLAGTGYDLTGLVYKATSTETSELVKELLKEMSDAPELQVASALPKELALISSYLEKGALTLNFSVEYASMDVTTEIRCRTAIVYTMLQIPGVEGVVFNVAGSPLVSNSGNTIGVMTADSFEYSINQTLREVELILYFADESGNYLLPEERDVVYRSGVTLERLVVEELIDGPAEEGHYPTLEQTLKLDNVAVRDNVCYLYFDNSFLMNYLEVADYIPIYSIVNSLSELSSISMVQFVFESNQEAIFRDSISLTGNFSRNLDYIMQEKD